MAENKKAFVLYADVLHTIKYLNDEQAGQLFKHILAYVNDENPTNENPIINIAFEPIKQQLKRDLNKWESTRKKRSEAGKKSAEVRKQKLTNSTSVKSVEQTSTKLNKINSNSNSNSNSYSNSNSNSNSNNKKRTISANAESDFLRFWDLYAKKTGKEKCLSIFKRLKKSEVEEIFEALPAYIAATPEIKYRKNPQTWLNGKHWRDEVDFSTDLTKTKNFEQPKFYEDEL